MIMMNVYNGILFAADFAFQLKCRMIDLELLLQLRFNLLRDNTSLTDQLIFYY